MKKINRMNGQSLIELLITLSVAVIVVTSISIAVISSLSNSQSSKNRNLASQYASEGMETIRSIRNNNYQAFKSYNGTYCLAKGQQTLGGNMASCPNANVDNFIRTIVIEQNPGCGNNATKTTVSVSWTDGKCPQNNLYCKTVPLISCFSTINPFPAP